MDKNTAIDIDNLRKDIDNLQTNLSGTAINLQNNQNGLQDQIINNNEFILHHSHKYMKIQSDRIYKIENLENIKNIENKQSIYYNYLNKKEFNENNNTIIIFADLVDSLEENTNSKGKIFYRTVTYDNNHIFSELIINSEEGNVYGTYIGKLDDLNYGTKHSKSYHIISSTGLYRNYNKMSLIKHDGDHKPREWILS